MAEALTQLHEADRQGPVSELVAYLRSHPYKFDHSRQELAERFGMDEEFVGDVLDVLRGSPNKLPKTESFYKAFTVSARMVGTYLTRVYEEFTERPVVAIFVTSLISIAIMLFTRQAAIMGILPVTQSELPEAVANIGILVGSTMSVLHAFVYFRHGMMRYALCGTGVFFGVALATFMYLGNGRDMTIQGGTVITAGNVYAFLIFASVLLSAFYFVFATIMSLAGGYWRTNKADREQKKLTRQELIDRLFHLQELLREKNFDPTARRRASIVGWLRTTPWIPIVGLCAGFVVGLVSVALRSGFAYAPDPDSDYYMGLPGVVTLVSQVIIACTFLGIGYLAGGIRRALVAVPLVFAGTLAAELLPFHYFGAEYFEFLVVSGKLREGLVNTLLVALFTGVGAHIDKRARVRQKLQERDAAHVTAEIVEIQWRLSPTAAASCVVVVDVAGSTRMKAEADPLAVEYSFRAFHDFVAGITAKRGGSVLSTAGDGAVLTFGSCAEALYAAKEIQTRLSQFNAHTNRLSSSFRVRIGIHTGNVSAELRDVPFNEIIDIAAHVEREAPVSGIALTKRVVENLGDERVAALQDQVDGQTVYVVLNPTLVV